MAPEVQRMVVEAIMLFSKVLIQDAMPHTLIYWAALSRWQTAQSCWSTLSA